MNINVGDCFTIDYPFYSQYCGIFNGKNEYILTPGCHRPEEDHDCGYGSTVIWFANYTGKIHYEILSIASMPGKYMDRVIVKYHYIQPDGKRYNSDKIKTLTTGKLINQITNERVFPCDYELDEEFK